MDDLVVVKLCGQLDLFNAPSFKSWINDSFIESGKRFIALDLSEVESMDSFALGVLISIYKNLRLKKGMLFLVSPQNSVKRVIEITSLDRIIPVVESVSEALERIK